jgi:urocanate hydratase
MTNDTASGVLRYADAGYEEALDEVHIKGIGRIDTNAAPTTPD